MRLYLLALLLLTSMLARAATPTVVLTWKAPTANTDGSTPANVMGYNVYRSSQLPVPTGGTAVPISKGTSLTASSLTYTDTAVPVGTFYYAVTAWGCDVPSTGNCIEGAPVVSGAVTIGNQPATPGAPGSVTVTVNGVQAP